MRFLTSRRDDGRFSGSIHKVGDTARRHETTWTKHDGKSLIPSGTQIDVGWTEVDTKQPTA